MDGVVVIGPVPRAGLDLAQIAAGRVADDAAMTMFKSKVDAARRLATALAGYRGRNPLVLAIPRGAVGMGKVLAEELGGELDVVLVRKRRAQYMPARSPVDPRGRIVIVVDDGLATGASIVAALHAARARQPQRLICAVPVAAPDSLERVRPLADEVVCLATPEEFYAVGQFYREFPQVEDEEVVAFLARDPQKEARE